MKILTLSIPNVKVECTSKEYFYCFFLLHISDIYFKTSLFGFLSRDLSILSNSDPIFEPSTGLIDNLLDKVFKNLTPTKQCKVYHPLTVWITVYLVMQC